MITARTSFRFFLISLLLLLSNGCASYLANRPEIAGKINTWIANEEYGRVLETISLIEPQHPDYARLKALEPDIQTRAKAWETALISNAQLLQRQGQWYKAEQRYLQGRENLPKSTELQAAQQQFLLARDVYLQNLQRQLLLVRGQQLPDEIELLDKLHAVTPGNQAEAKELQSKREALTTTREGLITCGDDALRQKDSGTAEQCYAVAHQIQASDVTQIALEQLRKPRQAAQQNQALLESNQALQQQKQREEEQRRAEADRIRKFNLELDSLNYTAEQQLARGDLLGARNSWQQVINLQPDYKDSKAKLAAVEGRIKNAVKTGLEQGNQYYTQSEYERAKQVWENALRLEPGNQELRQNLARVEKVLEKLKRLKEQPNGN